MNDYFRAPDLQELVEMHGGYDRITKKAWARFDQDMAEWHRARRVHTAGYVNDQQPAKRRKRVVARRTRAAPAPRRRRPHPALRAEAGGRLAELEGVIADINERLRMVAGDHFTLPPIEVPEPEVDEDAPRQALVSFDDDWAAATRALIARKAYGGGAA